MTAQQNALVDTPLSIDLSTVIYSSSHDCCDFRFTRDQWGCFSNFSNHTVTYQDRVWKSSEALYQAERFPFNPEIIEAIYLAETPKAAKEIAKANYDKTRIDWEDIKVEWMHEVLALKLASNPAIWRQIDLTGERPIVEVSTRDQFWGAKPSQNACYYVGSNVLGKLWMLIRERDIEYYFKHWRPAIRPHLQGQKQQWTF